MKVAALGLSTSFMAAVAPAMGCCWAGKGGLGCSFMAISRGGYYSSRFHGLGLPRLLVPDPSSHDPGRISGGTARSRTGIRSMHVA
jgi:hypothetical protein